MCNLLKISRQTTKSAKDEENGLVNTLGARYGFKISSIWCLKPILTHECMNDIVQMNCTPYTALPEFSWTNEVDESTVCARRQCKFSFCDGRIHQIWRIAYG